MNELRQAYRVLCEERGLDRDPAQQAVLDALSEFHAHSRDDPSSRRGFYLWGRVGRGKTMLMDLFFDGLHTANNEFHVADVDNAVVVELLLKQLVKSRVLVITTSNFEPTALVDDALGQEFIKNNPDSAVEGGGTLFQTSRRETLSLLLTEFQVVEISGRRDYRERFGHTHSPMLDANDSATTAKLNHRFQAAAGDELVVQHTDVFGRHVPCIKCCDSAIWLAYKDICEGNFSYRDYLELLSSRRLVILDGVNIRSLDGAKRFGWLVEVVYDSNKAFAASGTQSSGLFDRVDIPPHLSQEFARIQSRVTELTGRDR